MAQFSISDSLHRLVKHAIDSGVARNVKEAEDMFRGYSLKIEVDSAVATDSVCQAMLLTTVALGRRVFLGGVTVVGDINVNLSIALPFGQTLAEAVSALGGSPSESDSSAATIVIGGSPIERRQGFCIRTAAAGWRGGILPAHSELIPESGPTMPLAGMLAAALAVNEAYLFVSGGAPSAGQRVLGMSLWEPDGEVDWLKSNPNEPTLSYLPSHLWMIGLGHLGQAYLWGLALLPYRKPKDVSIVLQDFDIITPSTESTSILTSADIIGQKKTRAMAAWAEHRGFTTSIHERRFDASFCRQESEPAVALCGIDNGHGRRFLDQVGFSLIVEAGLGRGHRDFRTMRLHTLPSSRPAADIWKSEQTDTSLGTQSAYKDLVDSGTLDRCGMTLLAGKAVGAPFVGATAATLALSEILRFLHGGRVHGMIDLDLLSFEQRVATPHKQDFSHLNPGFTLVI